MDYLDPKKQRQHALMLWAAYILCAIGIIAVTWLLFNVSYGYGRGKNGQIVLNGLVYVSSQPQAANITINAKPAKSQTNTRLLIPAGRYALQLTRNGYRTWQRTITVEGGDVQHFDYPFLFPTKLSTTNLTQYASSPGLATQSPDLRWLVVEQAGSLTNFDLYDLKSPTKAPVVLTLPASLLTAGANQSWQLVEWSTDNQHLLLNHIHDGANEFIVVDRQNPAQSVNLNKTFNATPTAISLKDKKYDQFYVFDATNQTLQTASLKSTQFTPYLEHVLSYKSYGNNTMLYATSVGAAAGKTAIAMQEGDHNYHIRDISTAGSYPLDLTQYKGALYVIIASSTENKVFIYKDPVGQLNATPNRPAAALRALLISQPSYVSFSANTQFIMAESGASLTVYDLENAKNYRYNLAAPLDAPQTHVGWMDGDRIAYASNGKVIVGDYDNTNVQTLVTATATYQPFFAPDYKHLFTLAPLANAEALTETSLLTPAGQ